MPPRCPGGLGLSESHSLCSERVVLLEQRALGPPGTCACRSSIKSATLSFPRIVSICHAVGPYAKGCGRDEVVGGEKGDALVILERWRRAGCQEDEIVCIAQIKPGIGGGVQSTVSGVENQQAIYGIQVVCWEGSRVRREPSVDNADRGSTGHACQG